jgi:HSP20 family protein
VATDKHGWKVRMGLPGVESKDVHVELDHTTLTVSGERTVKEESADRHLSEIGYGRFERRFTLPENVDSEKVSARFENGMLELTLPVAEVVQNRRRIEIAGANKVEKPEKAA